MFSYILYLSEACPLCFPVLNPDMVNPFFSNINAGIILFTNLFEEEKIRKKIQIHLILMHDKIIVWNFVFFMFSDGDE